MLDRRERALLREHWRLILSNLLGWSDDAIARWMVHWEPRLNSPHSMLNHELAGHWTQGQFIPSEFITRFIGYEIEMIGGEISQAIGWVENIKTEADWEKVAGEIDEILKKHGGSLAAVRKEHAEGTHISQNRTRR